MLRYVLSIQEREAALRRSFRRGNRAQVAAAAACVERGHFSWRWLLDEKLVVCCPCLVSAAPASWFCRRTYLPSVVFPFVSMRDLRFKTKPGPQILSLLPLPLAFQCRIPVVPQLSAKCMLFKFYVAYSCLTRGWGIFWLAFSSTITYYNDDRLTLISLELKQKTIRDAGRGITGVGESLGEVTISHVTELSSRSNFNGFPKSFFAQLLLIWLD